MNSLKWALDNIKLQSDGHGSIFILHVQSPPSISSGISPPGIPFGGPSDLEVPAFTAAIEEHQTRITQAILDHALNICAHQNVQVNTKVVIGDPKHKICQVVQEMHADLLVMGSRAFGPIKRMFLGSVSTYCSNHAECPGYDSQGPYNSQGCFLISLYRCFLSEMCIKSYNSGL